MSAASVSAVARMMFGHAANRKMIAMLGAFFDDSGTHSTSPVVVIGGLLGTAEQWDDFVPAWNALLVVRVIDSRLNIRIDGSAT